jgi:hypothetical protein
MTKEIKLSKEEFNQLAEENAQLLNKRILLLSELLKKKNLNSKKFWIQSKEIHLLFKKITPLHNADRVHLWKLFEDVREEAREKFKKEKLYEKVIEKRFEIEINSLIDELDTFIKSNTDKPSDVEYLLFLSQQLKSFLKGDFENLPDSPDLAFVLARRKGRKLLNKSLIGRIERYLIKCKTFLDTASNHKFLKIMESIQSLSKSETPKNKTKNLMKQIRKEISHPILVKDQKEKLIKEIKISFGEAAFKEKNKRAVETHKKKSLSTMDEVNFIIEDLKEKFLNDT